MKLKLANHEIIELKKTLQILEKELKIEKGMNMGTKESVSQYERRIDSLNDQIKSLSADKFSLSKQLDEFKVKYDEMYRVYSETEKVVAERLKTYSDKLLDKEKEIEKLKEIVYEREASIKKISVAHL